MDEPVIRKAESPMRFIHIALVSSLLAVGQAEAAEPVMTVVSARAMSKQTATLVHGTGTVAPWREVQVSADVQGVVISEMVVEPGDSVAVGDTLAVLDDRALATALERAVAAERSAEADLAQASAALARGRSLSSSKAVSEESIESLETAAARAEAAKAQAKANLSDASRDAEKALVRSPVAGTVLSVALNAGATSTNGALVVVAREGRLEVSADVPERRLSLVRPGQPVSIKGLDGAVQQGTVRLVSPVVDEKTHLGKVVVTLNGPGSLRTGMFARVAISAEPREAVVVPAGAITYRANTATVFRIGDDARVEAVKVVPGQTSDGLTSVEGGIADGDAVVVDGAGFVEDGDLVAIAGAAR